MTKFAQTTTTTLELKGNYTFNFFQYQEDVGCVCMLIASSAAFTILAPVVNDRCSMVQTVQKTVDIYGHDHRDFTVAVHLKGG